MLVGIVEFLGWFGAVTVLAGYILFSTGKLPNGPVYQLFNLVGGLAVAINVAAHHAVPSTIVNGIWAIVAVVVLVKMGRARRAAKRDGSVSTEPPVLHAEPAGDHRRSCRSSARRCVTTSRRTPPRRTRPRASSPTTRRTRRRRTPDATQRRMPPAPMTETVPIITATIALALVAAAQEQPTGRTVASTPTHTGHAEPAR